MPPRNWTLRVADILDAIAAIHQFTAGMDYAAFQIYLPPLMPQLQHILDEKH